MNDIGFRNFNPISAFIYFLFCFLLSLISLNPILLAVSLFCSALYCIKLHGKRAVKSLFTFYLPLVILISVFNAAFSHYGVTELFTLKSGNSVTLEALVYGAVFGFRTVCILLWLDCFNEVFSAEKIIWLFSRFSPKIALVISMTLRFIPLLRESAENIRKARRGLGIDSNSESGIKKFKLAAHEMSILITKALESAADTADSMNSRGYGLKGRTYYSPYRFKAKDAAVLVSTLLAGLFYALNRNALYSSYNPVIYVEKPNVFSVLFTVYLLLLFLFPLFYDLWEERLWTALK